MNRGGWEVGLGRSRMHPTVLLCALTSVCVYVYGEVAVAVAVVVVGGGVAYVRSCAHIHQWNVKREEGGRGGFSSLLSFSSASLFSVLSLLRCSVGLFV